MTRGKWLCVVIFIGGMSLMWGNVQIQRSDPKEDRRVIVLGIDAMDYGITGKLLSEGKLPHLQTIAKQGTFIPLQTCMPPLSPVAWTNFITGTNPGGHDVFDFLRRNPQKVSDGFLPEDGVTELSTTSTDAEWPIPFTSYVWPEAQKQSLRRKPQAFWELMEDRGIPATIYKVPGNFPVSATLAKTLSGMGTPDIEGTYGMFTYLTDQSIDWTKDISGGRIFKAEITNGKVTVDGGEPYLTGPANIFLPNKEPVKIPFQVYVDPSHKSAVIRIQNHELLLNQVEWSSWVLVSFELLPGVKTVQGLVRFYLKEVSPAFRLYLSPVNLASGTEGLATSHFDVELMKAIGLYDTKGMPEETKAFTQGIFTTEEYLKQSDLVLNKDIEALNYLLDHQQGFLFFYFSNIDLDSHVLWKYQDSENPAYEKNSHYTDAIRHRYIQMDKVIGSVLAKLGPQDVLYIMSDHGFTSFHREFNLVTWLESEGYLVYSSPLKRRLSKMYSDIDWSQSRAFGIGFNGLYLNLKGREVNGTVEPEKSEVLIEEIRSKLLALKDQGKAVFSHIYRPEEIYSGSYLGGAPDLILGYNSGFGPSDQSVLGSWTPDILADHLDGFSGQHEVDYKLVPGVFFSTRKLSRGKTTLEDVTVTVLKEYGIDRGTMMTGEPLF